MNTNFWVTRDAISQGFSLVTLPFVKIIGKSPLMTQKSLFMVTHALFFMYLYPLRCHSTVKSDSHLLAVSLYLLFVRIFRAVAYQYRNPYWLSKYGVSIS